MPEDPVTAAATYLLEAECLEEPGQIIEVDVAD